MTTPFPVTPLDAEWLAELHAAAFPPDEAWPATLFATLLGQPGARGSAIRIDDEPAGLLLARFVGDEAEVLTFAVAPDRRRRGLGRALLEDCIAAARAALLERMVFEAAVDNFPAVALYESCGFTPQGTRRNYYGRGELRVDALIMTKSLT